MSKQKISLFILASFFLIKTSFAADAIDMQYIKYIWNDTYRLYWTNLWTDASQLKVFLWGTELTDINKNLTQNYLEIWKLQKTMWDLLIEKSITSINSWVTSTTSERTSSMKFIKEDSILLKNTYTTEVKQWTNVVIIPLIKDISNWLSYTPSWTIERIFTINVNWTDYTLNKDAASYEAGKYYYNANSIIIPYNNLNLADNIIRLRIDTLYSNYININKEKYTLYQPTDITTEDYNSSRYVKLLFNKPSEINDLSNIEVYINWAKITPTDVNLVNNNISVRYDILKITKDDKIFNIYYKNTTNSNYSNTIAVNLESMIDNRINKIDFWNTNTNSFILKIIWTTWLFIWDVWKVKLILNWDEYSIDWTKQTIKNSSGEVIKDINWYESYEYIRKITLTRSDNQLNINFAQSYFTWWENVLYIRNENTSKESNKISFTKWQYSNINYDYVAWAQAVVVTQKENMTYENWADILDKKIDYLYNPSRDITLWKINFNNLKSWEFYRIYFKLSTNLTINPFYQAKLWSLDFVPITESNWTISYVFDKSLYGKDFISNNIIFNLNEIYNLIDQNNIKFSLSGLSISRYSGSNSSTISIFENKNTTDINLSYKYDISYCYDWTKDYCSSQKLNKPSLTLNFAFGKIIVNTSSSDNVTTQSISTNTKKNSPITNINFKTSKFKIYNDKFTKLYDDIKAKNITARQATTLKNSINSILKALKNYEDNISKQEANNTIKSNIRNILEIIKSTK